MPRSNLSKVFGSRRSQSGSNGQSPPVVPHPQPFPNSATRFPNARDREGKVIPLVAAGHIRPKPLPDELTRTLSGIAEPHARVEAASDYMLSEITRACQLEDVAAAIGVSPGTLIQTITSRPSVAMCFAIALEASSHLLDNLARDIMDGTTPVEGPAARNPKILANYAISFRASAESRRRLSEGIIRRSSVLGDDMVLRRKDEMSTPVSTRSERATILDNAKWAIDFKGWFCTRDGTLRPLTQRGRPLSRGHPRMVNSRELACAARGSGHSRSSGCRMRIRSDNGSELGTTGWRAFGG